MDILKENEPSLVYTIVKDFEGVYADNTDISPTDLVNDYIDGLCLNEPNDKECAEWLNGLLAKKTKIHTDIAMSFIASMWRLEIVPKEN